MGNYMKVIKLTENNNNNNTLTENKADEYYRKLAQKLYDEHKKLMDRLKDK